MNHIDARIMNNKYNNCYLAIHIDNVPLDSLLSELTQSENYLELMPAWLPLENEREQKYVWEILDKDNIQGLSLPILLCPEDMDFTCIIIIAKVFYKQNEVTWEKIGIVDNNKWSIMEWRKSGIRNIENWSDLDWEKYGGTLNITDIWDKCWENWISENWSYEEHLRVHNYTHQYINDDANIKWFSNIPILNFNKKEYKACIEAFRMYSQIDGI